MQITITVISWKLRSATRLRKQQVQPPGRHFDKITSIRVTMV